MHTTEGVVRDFLSAINDHDVEAIVRLSSQDHQFVDAYGAVVPYHQLREAWSNYFAFMPQYGVEVETILAQGERAAIFGFAWGGLEASNPSARVWRRPCAWQALVEGEMVRLWQVFVDTKAVFDLL